MSSCHLVLDRPNYIFPPSLLCRLAILYLIVPTIFSLLLYYVVLPSSWSQQSLYRLDNTLPLRIVSCRQKTLSKHGYQMVHRLDNGHKHCYRVFPRTLCMLHPVPMSCHTCHTRYPCLLSHLSHPVPMSSVTLVTPGTHVFFNTCHTRYPCLLSHLSHPVPMSSVTPVTPSTHVFCHTCHTQYLCLLSHLSHLSHPVPMSSVTPVTPGTYSLLSHLSHLSHPVPCLLSHLSHLSHPVPMSSVTPVTRYLCLLSHLLHLSHRYLCLL